MTHGCPRCGYDHARCRMCEQRMTPPRVSVYCDECRDMGEALDAGAHPAEAFVPGGGRVVARVS